MFISRVANCLLQYFCHLDTALRRQSEEFVPKIDATSNAWMKSLRKTNKLYCINYAADQSTQQIQSNTNYFYQLRNEMK